MKGEWLVGTIESNVLIWLSSFDAILSLSFEKDALQADAWDGHQSKINM